MTLLTKTFGFDIAAPACVSDMITEMDGNRFATHSLQDPRILRILSAAIKAVDPYLAVQRNLPRLEGRVFGLGIGKAALPMMDALAERIPLVGGLAVTKFAAGPSRAYTVMVGGHPVPDVRSLQAGEAVLKFVSSLREDDTLFCLISGGGSALVTAPLVPLQDLQTLTSLLLASGARIDEINMLRRQLDRVKGGGVALATKANVISLILSDVVGNPLETIASGPTVPNPTTREAAIAVLKKYDLEARLPISIKQIMESRGARAPLPAFQEQAPGLHNVQNIIIGDNVLAAKAALEQARQEGFDAAILMNDLQGEARKAGVTLASRLREETTKRPRPFCLIAGGETTVRVKGQGLGGRNQELALSAVEELSGLENVILIALATDGDDGPTDAAGAVVTGESAQRAAVLGLDAADYLSRNDSYPFFMQLGDLIKSGPTGTNVNDLIFLFAI
jgi:glycerate 2-kinase